MDNTQLLSNQHLDRNKKEPISKEELKMNYQFEKPQLQFPNVCEKELVKRESLITNRVTLSENKACISLVRKKENQHGFLLIEYVDQDEYYTFPQSLSQKSLWGRVSVAGGF